MRLRLVWAVAGMMACGGGEQRAAAGGDTPVAGAATTTAQARPNGCGGDRAPAVVGPGFVGPLRVGGRLGDIPQACAVRDTSYTLGEGLTERGWVVELPGGGTAVVETAGGARDSAITRVFVDGERARTEGEVGVGSAVGDLRRAHGATCQAAGEGTVVVAARALRGVSFVTDVKPGAPGDVPDSARLTRIIVVDSTSSLCR